MSFYPAGVSGNEYEISGPEREWEESFFCQECDSPQLFYMESYQRVIWGVCQNCDTELDEDLVEERYSYDWDED